MTIRHGDRSSIHALLDSDHEQKLDCDDSSAELKRIREEFVSRASIISLEGETLSKSKFWPKLVNKTFCAPGHLTSEGFSQHVELGRALRIPYGNLLGEVKSEELYIRSTNYERTIQSASALMSQLLPAHMEVKIAVDLNDGREVMHGVGYRTTSEKNKSVSSNQEQEFDGTCMFSSKSTREQLVLFELDKNVKGNLVAALGDSIKTKTVSEITENMYARVCHSNPLPCLKHCVTTTVFEELSSESDRYYCDRFSGQNGGIDSSNSLIPASRKLTMQSI